MEVSGVSRCEYYHRREELRREDWSSANLVCGRYCARPAALGKAAPTAKHPRGPCFTGNSETVLIAAWWSKKAANNHDDPPWLRVLCVVLRELLQAVAKNEMEVRQTSLSSPLCTKDSKEREVCSFLGDASSIGSLCNTQHSLASLLWVSATAKTTQLWMLESAGCCKKTRL